MNTRWIVIALAGALLAGCKGKTEVKKAHAPIKPLPGTEAVQSLLTGVGKSAAPAQGTAVALGGIFGKGGVLGAGPSLGMGVTGSTTGPRPIDPDRVDGTGGADPMDTTYANGGDRVDPPEDPPALPPVQVPPPVTAGGDCAAVAQRVGDLARAVMDAQLASIDAEARATTETMVRDTLAAIPLMIEQACTSQNWPQELKDCVLTGRDLEALQTCERYVTPQMRAAAEAEATQAQAAARPSTPAPTWNGASSDCAATAAHAAALAAWELSAAPADMRATGESMLPQIQAGVESACTAAAWSDAQRRCILSAGSIEAMNTCTGG